MRHTHWAATAAKMFLALSLGLCLLAAMMCMAYGAGTPGSPADSGEAMRRRR